MLAESFIIGADAVVDRFGDWPTFHDMEVVSLGMDRRGPDGPVLEFLVHVWKRTTRVTSDGHYERILHSLIRFRCARVDANEFEGFNFQNVLDGLSLSQLEGGGVRVELSTNYGLTGGFTCGEVRVIEVIPATPEGEPLPAA